MASETTLSSETNARTVGRDLAPGQPVTDVNGLPAEHLSAPPSCFSSGDEAAPVQALLRCSSRSAAPGFELLRRQVFLHVRLVFRREDDIAHAARLAANTFSLIPPTGSTFPPT